jgi:hypothetical protein
MPTPLPPGTWPKASDEADGNVGRPQPGFFRITGKKYFVTLPQMAWAGEFFSSDIMWWLGDWTRLILHQLPLPRKSLKRGKDILVFSGSPERRGPCAGQRGL